MEIGFILKILTTGFAFPFSLKRLVRRSVLLPDLVTVTGSGHSAAFLSAHSVQHPVRCEIQVRFKERILSLNAVPYSHIFYGTGAGFPLTT